VGPGSDPTINEMVLRHLRHADAYYRKPDGRPTTEPVNIRLALRPLRKLYGHTLARDFGPLAMKTVRQSMIDSDRCRAEVNKRVRHAVRAFKWAVVEEIVPASVHRGLKAVNDLRGGAPKRESKPVKPVPDEFVGAIRPHVSSSWRRRCGRRDGTADESSIAGPLPDGSGRRLPGPQFQINPRAPRAAGPGPRTLRPDEATP
jgi:hypothetical protein